MTGQLKGKTAVVTGATSGIGLAIAKALAAERATLVINGLGSEEEIALVVRQIEAQGNGVRVQHKDVDLRNPEATRRCIQEVESEHGAVDILVNNAGIQHTDRIEDFPMEKWDDVIATNLSAVFHTTAAALPGMQSRGYGRIINIASVHGLVASKNKAAYVSAKHGTVGLTKVTALENAGRNITCNCICPGWVLTPLVEAQIKKTAKAENVSEQEAMQMMLREKEPSQRFTKVEELAGAVLFLLSDAGDNVSGTSMVMDGGWTAQ